MNTLKRIYEYDAINWLTMFSQTPKSFHMEMLVIKVNFQDHFNT